ncbi:MAG: trigger factor [Trueperaceae bacterium]
MEAQLVEKKAVTATVNITIEAADVDRAFEQVLGRLSRQVRVPGFRPGKVPMGVLERRIGAEALGEEVRDSLVDDAYPRAMRDLELVPVDAHFHADTPVRGQNYEIVVHAELFPDVKLPDLSTVTVEARTQEIGQEQLDDAIEQIRRENSTLVPVDRPVQETDWVLLESLPKEGEEEPEDGAGASFPVDLERAGDELKGQLLGKSMGDEVTIELTDTAVDDDEGNPVVRQVPVRVADVKEKELPEPGEEFATQLGLDSWDEVLERVKESLTDQARRDGFQTQQNELIEKLIDGAELELPPSLVNRRKRSLLQDLAYDLSQQGMTFEAYLKRLDERGSTEEFEAELDEAAQKGVRRDLVLERLMEERGTELTDAEFMAAAKHLAQQRGQDVGRMLAELGEEWENNYRFLLRRDKTVREMVAELTGETRVGFDANVIEEAADAAMGADDEDDDHDHHHHDHDH